MKTNTIIRYSLSSLLGILICLLSCTIACVESETDTLYDPASPPFKIGTYESIEQNASGQQMNYEMGVHLTAHNSRHHQIELCNFGDLRITIIAYISEDLQISIPAQQFSTDFWNFEIFQGTGRMTEDGFTLTYWASNQMQNYQSEIEAHKI